MARIILKLSDEELDAIVERIVERALKKLDIESIVRAAATETMKQTRRRTKKWFPAKVAADLLGITMCALQNRRLAGRIKGRKEEGGRSFLYSKAELERLLGEPLE